MVSLCVCQSAPVCALVVPVCCEQTSSKSSPSSRQRRKTRMDQIKTNRRAPGHLQRAVSYHFLPATLVLLEMFKMQFIGPTIGSEEIFLASLLIVGIRSRC